MRPQRKGTIPEETSAPPFDLCLAKTWLNNSGQILPGRTVFDHCKIVAKVAEELLRRYPNQLAQELFPSCATVLPALHDVGKISPTFSNKIVSHLTNSKREIYKNWSGINESKWGGHAGVSQLTLMELTTAPYLAEIVGQHHGMTPPVAADDIIAEKFGGSAWQKERKKFVAEMLHYLHCDWPAITDHATALLVAGLTTVSDWIGSGDFFEDPDENWRKNICPALDAAGFISPKYLPNLTFEDIFTFSPYPTQKALIETAKKPGIYILEAPMGQGKTEAALYAAYSMVAKGKASGIYFALPTQLTSNKIHDRFNAFLSKILEPNSPHYQALLLHGSAWMVETQMGEEGQPGYSWFNARKRGLLAPFAVGTIDQALMAVMNVKHGFVRAFGLAGKVVILDEIHTYDIYTGTILEALVRLLQQLQCTVIILSATLSSKRRGLLLERTVKETAYPLVSGRFSNNSEKLIEIPLEQESSQRINLYKTTSDEEAIEEVLKKIEQGQQVLWIENTVDQAQQQYLNLAARATELNCECGLLHSRFTPQDREKNENYWVDLFGKSGWEKRQDRGRILVGTQVLEQSLDIDADFLVSRFCPTDMLLQRLGRLWRHEKTPRPDPARAEAWLLIPKQGENVDPERIFGPSGYVYSPYVLHRTLEVWLEKNAVRLPADIRDLIEETYEEREETSFMIHLQDLLENGDRYHKGTRALRQFANLTLAEIGKTLPESKAETRYSEQDNCEVFLYRNLHRDKNLRESTFTLLDDSTITIPWDHHKLSWKGWRETARQLMRQIVNIRPKYIPEAVNRNSLQKTGLGNCLYLGPPDEQTAQLRIAQVDGRGKLSGFDGAEIHIEYDLRYRHNLGYIIHKKGA